MGYYKLQTQNLVGVGSPQTGRAWRGEGGLSH